MFKSLFIINLLFSFNCFALDKNLPVNGSSLPTLHILTHYGEEIDLDHKTLFLPKGSNQIHFESIELSDGQILDKSEIKTILKKWSTSLSKSKNGGNGGGG